MAIRSNALGHYGDLAPELQEILRKNGMQAHVVMQGDRYQLAVQGHDSPLLTYSLTSQQLSALTDGGTNYSNKSAYNTFAALVSSDFDIPKDYVHARNANGRVAMGLHGYRIGTGEYGRPMENGRNPVRPAMDMWGHRGILGWTPRQQEGYHLRRSGGELLYQGAPMVAERSDGRMKPGELQSGSYGFYWKGQQKEAKPAGQDVLLELQNVTPVIQARPRSEEAAKPYREVITSDVYFTSDKLQEVLSSHGILIDEEKKLLTVQSQSINKDFAYDLTDDELKRLTSPSLREEPVQSRLDLINGIIGQDYKDGITMDMLSSKERISIEVRPEVIQELRGKEQTVMQQVSLASGPVMDGQQVYTDPFIQERDDARIGIARVDGQSLYSMQDQAWYREGRNGREVSVGEIKVEPVRNPKEDSREMSGEMKYRMTAVINGESVSHEITQKQYDKFMAVDDYHRMKLFSKVFSEVDMKDIPREHDGRSFGVGLLAALTVAGEVARGHAAGRMAPDIYMERHAGGHVYMKPGVDTAQDIASRAFEAGINAADHGVGLGR